MAQKAHSLSHTKWMCKYHIVFTPKYRRKVIYNRHIGLGQEAYDALTLFCYVTISPSHSVRCETNKPPAMRVRLEGYTKKTPNAIQ